jgi:glycosyltransferase involved in cell wall biosynthesis
MRDVRELISVLIPVHNVAPFVREAVGSITAQTYPHLEIIIVDDASTDGTWELLREMAQADRRIVLLRNAENKKIAYSLNRALSIARGRYIARMDGDDVAHLERIERQLSYLLEHPEVALAGVNTASIDADGVEFARSEFPSDQHTIARCLTLTTLVSHNWLCRREVYEDLGGYREVAPVEDYDFLLRMHCKGHRFSNLAFCGMKIRFRDGNTATAAGLEQIRAFEYVTRLYRERIRTGTDSFSPEAFRSRTRASPALRALHARSVAFLLRSFEARRRGRRVAMIWFGLASVITSPAQLRVIWRRRLMHMFSRSSPKRRDDSVAQTGARDSPQAEPVGVTSSQAGPGGTRR